jgi:hypothetical protein
MPLKTKDSKGQTKKRSFQENVGDLQKKGYSKEAAQKITAKIQQNQEGKSKKKK